jgi:hypothetical protein
MAGLASLGELFGDMAGGGQEMRLAEASTQGRYRSAQTEQALATARKNQADAVKAEQINIIADQLLANPPDFLKPSNQNLADMMVGGYGSDFSAVNKGALEGQERDYRTQIAAPTTAPADQQRLRAAVGDAPFNPIDAVGTRGAFSDARNPDKGVQKPLGEEMFPVDPTSAIQNFEYGQKLPPDKQAAFSPYVRPDQVIDVGGGVKVTKPQIGNTPARPVAPVEQVASNTRDIAAAKAEGTGMGKRTLDLPAAKARVAATSAKLDAMGSVAQKLQQDEALWSAVGLGQPIARIAGTDGAKLRANINTLKAKVGFAVLQDMREASPTGGALGNVSDKENKFLQEALASLDTQLSPEDFREQLQILLDYVGESKARLNQAFLDTYPELNQQQGGNLPSFATEAEAEAAGLTPGTKVVIGGRTGTWQ